MDGVSFAIAEGEIPGLVGESGSGTSVTGQSIMGLLPAAGRITAGEVRFDGRDLPAPPPGNAVWKRFWRLSRAGAFEAMFDTLAATSRTAHLVQMFDATTARAHVSAAGAGGRTARPSAAREAASRPRSTSGPTMQACPSPST